MARNRISSHGDLLESLRGQADTLLSDQVAPALSNAASTAAAPFRLALDYLPAVVDLMASLGRRTSRAAGQVRQEAMAPVQQYLPARARLQPYLVGAVVAGIGYFAFRVWQDQRRRRPRAQRTVM